VAVISAPRSLERGKSVNVDVGGVPVELTPLLRLADAVVMDDEGSADPNVNLRVLGKYGKY
jgi:hypothetical protein